jgi:hypothetical protein
MIPLLISGTRWKTGWQTDRQAVVARKLAPKQDWIKVRSYIRFSLRFYPKLHPFLLLHMRRNSTSTYHP